jgi:putative alpha-1,2-mannosidase
MGSFTAFAMSGLFPNAGQDVYLIIPPFFKSVSYLNSLTNKTATVKSKNFDASYKDIFIQNATMNGKPWTKNWVGHEFFSQGWTLELVLGPTESEWGTKVANLPPSLGARTGAMMI